MVRIVKAPLDHDETQILNLCRDEFDLNDCKLEQHHEGPSIYLEHPPPETKAVVVTTSGATGSIRIWQKEPVDQIALIPCEGPGHTIILWESDWIKPSTPRIPLKAEAVMYWG